MDLKKQFKELELDKNLDTDVAKIQKDLNTTNLPEKQEDFDESDHIIKTLEDKLKNLKRGEGAEEVTVDENGEEVIYEELEEQTFLEKIQPFIIPICLTLFAIIFAALFLYFFSKSKTENAAQAIINAGVAEQVYYPPVPIPVVIKEDPLVCEEPQVLSEDKTVCVDPEPEPIPEPTKPKFENGTTTIVSVRFSFDKQSYDNTPRGIFLLEEQIFTGGFKDFKINPTNRAYANDYFFGVDRYMVSLIGSCSYVVDDAKILVKNMNEGNGTFTGDVLKVIESTKPRIDCEK